MTVLGAAGVIVLPQGRNSGLQSLCPSHRVWGDREGLGWQCSLGESGQGRPLWQVLSFFLGHAALVPQPGFEPIPLLWECGVFTGPPGKFLSGRFKEQS